MRTTLLITLTALVAACANTTRTETAGAAETTTFRLAYNNAHLIRVADRTVLFDAGLERHAASLLDAMADLDGVVAEDFDAIVLSHGHADHAGGAAALRAATGAPIVMGEADQFLAEQGHNDALCPTDGTAERRLEAAQAETFTTFAPDTVLGTDSSATLGRLLGWEEEAGRLHSVPGHTPGSLALVVGDAVFAGDLLRGSVTGSAARTHYYLCDLDDNTQDLRLLLDTVAPRGERFFLGHFGPVDRSDVERLLEERRAPTD